MKDKVEFEKNVICGEILYFIAVYEKGKCCMKEYWRRKGLKRLKKSLVVMKELVDDLDNREDVTLSPHILSFVKESGIFSTDASERIVSLKNKVLRNNLLLDNSYRGVNLLMKDILATIEELISKIEQSILIFNYRKISLYREEIKGLLKGLHNLPRIYVDGSGIIEERPIHLIMPKEAIEYSFSWLATTSIDVKKYQ